MDSNSAIASATSRAAKTAAPRKRRGRPRSPVFAYFRRLVDENGHFAGNACQFCSFISRDRSENPTYLTRHILRTCSAPQDVKDAMGVRHPTIAIPAYGNANRLVAQKARLTPVAPAPLMPDIALQAVNVPRPVQRVDRVPAQRQNGEQPQQQVHLQGAGQDPHLDTSRPSQPPRLAPKPNHVPPDIPPAAAQIRTPQNTSVPKVPKRIEPAQPNKESFQVTTQDNFEVVPGHQQQRDNHLQTRSIRQSPTPTPAPTPTPPPKTQPVHPQNHAQLQSPSNRQQENIKDEQPDVQLQEQVTKESAMHVEVESNHALSAVGDLTKTVPSQPPDPQFRRAGIVQTMIRPVGITKSRRGRPRSQALRHFRRHVDFTGTFIANQCIHCSFVSRDRSENSTLLLRHLLSKACKAPESDRAVLRGNRYDENGKRTFVGNKAANSKNSKKMAGGPVQSKDTKQPSAPRCAPNIEVVSKALVRFFSKNDIDLSAVESPPFVDLVRVLTTTTPFSGDPLSADTQAQDQLMAEGDVRRDSECPTYILPTTEVLEGFRGKALASQILDDIVNHDDEHSSVQLLIYFPLHVFPVEYQLPDVHARPSGDNVERAFVDQPALVASAFQWSSTSQLRYVGSKNCTGDFLGKLEEFLEECKAAVMGDHGGFDHIFISRPLRSPERTFDIPRQESLNTWVPDVAREIHILSQELLTQVPFLARCLKRNRLLACFFRERLNEGAVVILFGHQFMGKEVFGEYLQHVGRVSPDRQCKDVLKTAMNTYAMLCKVQANHEDPQKVRETTTFLRRLNEENSGFGQIGQEVIRLVLSVQYRNELKAFISILKPISNLISLYSQPESRSPIEGSCTGISYAKGTEAFSATRPFQARSISHLLPDCVKLLREIYAEKLQDYDSDMRILRGRTACRLLGKNSDGCPPIVDDICYVAAFLNPSTDLSATNEISVEEAWRRAVAFLHSQYNDGTDVTLERVLEQLQSFHRRTGVFSVPEIFNDAHEFEDPRCWWQKHGSLAPELCSVACKVLSAPTTSFQVVQVISEQNSTEADLLQHERDQMKEKQRVLRWNMNLASLDTSKEEPQVTREILEVP